LRIEFDDDAVIVLTEESKEHIFVASYIRELLGDEIWRAREIGNLLKLKRIWTVRRLLRQIKGISRFWDGRKCYFCATTILKQLQEKGVVSVERFPRVRFRRRLNTLPSFFSEKLLEEVLF